MCARFAAALFALVCLQAACASGREVDLSKQGPATWTLEPGGYEVAIVERVIDGDTIEVRITGIRRGLGAGETSIGRDYVVRLLGIDTPETVAPNSPVECFGPEASSASTALLEGESVRLVKDVEESDSFGRLLRYVYMGHEMANARLVVNGYAYSFPYAPDARHSELFADLEGSARSREAGLWGTESCSDGGPSP